MILEDYLQFYIRILKRKPVLFAAVLALYIIFAVGVFAQHFYTMETKRHQTEIMELQKEIDQKDENLTYLEKTTPRPAIFKDLMFDEKWNSDETRANVLRLVDYAKYAEQKADYRYADQLFTEANGIQETLTVNYYEGRNAYYSGDLDQAEAKWRRFLEMDAKNHYPEVRFYLACLLYERGRERECKEMLRTYITTPVQ